MNSFFRLLFFIIIIQNIYSQEYPGFFSLKDTSAARLFCEKGDLLFSKAEYDSSNLYFEKAKQIYKYLSESDTGKSIWSGLILCYNEIGWNYLVQEQYTPALEQLDSALTLGLIRYGENHPDIARTYNHIGSVYSRKSDYNKAIDYYKKSLSIGLTWFGENDPRTAMVCGNIGNMYYFKGDFEQALEFHQRALRIREKILPPDHPDIAISYNIAGIHCYESGDYDKALDYYRKALLIRMNNYGEIHPEVGQIYNNIGVVFEHKQDYDEALSYYHKVLDINLNVFGEIYSKTALNYCNIGHIFRFKNQYDSALYYYRKSLSIIDQLKGGEKHFIVSENLTNIGHIYKDLGDYGRALENYRKSVTAGIDLHGEQHPDVALNYRSIAEVYLILDETDSALIYCQKSIKAVVPAFIDTSVFQNPVPERITSELNLLSSMQLKAEIFASLAGVENQAYLEHALSAYSLASELIDRIRTGYRAEGSKLLLGEKAFKIFDRSIQTCLRLYNLTKDESYKERAFSFAEKSKAAVLQSELTEVKAKEFAGMDPALLHEEKQLKIELAFYDTQLQQKYQQQEKSYRDSIEIRDYEDRIFELNSRYEELITEFEKKYPAYYNLKYQTATRSTAEIRDLLPENSAMLEYFSGDSLIYIFSFTENGFDIVTVNKPGGFTEIVKDFYSSILKSELKKYYLSASSLTDILINPVRDKLAGKENLIFIPDDILYKIPFEALFAESEESGIKPEKVSYARFNYLINKFNISYHYSAGLFADQTGKYKSSGLPVVKNFTGFAPVFAGTNSQGYIIASTGSFISDADTVRSSSGNKDFSELKYSEWELRSIISLFKKNHKPAVAYFHNDATEENFKKNINNYSIIHIASHSFINDLSPQISGVAFAKDERSNSGSILSDGILYAGETYSLDLEADLLVLSSCESGIGKLVRGEGMMSLSRGFLYSGTGNIIFSLWKIPDKHTSELMVLFYKELFSGKNYAGALREAKIKMIKDESTARPRSWAGFLLIGAGL